MRSGLRACLTTALVLLSITFVAGAAGSLQQLQNEDTWTIHLPPGSQPEGIAAGADNDLWVSCLSGAIIHVDLTTNTTSQIHKEHNVPLSGVKFCKKQKLLFVAGTLTGKAFIYHMKKQPKGVDPPFKVIQKEVLSLNMPSQGYINDVALSQDRAYFTDSFKPVLYWVPRFSRNQSDTQTQPGVADMAEPPPRPIYKVDTGDFFDTKVGQFRANGIAVYASKPSKDILLVANTHAGTLYRIVVDKRANSTASSATSRLQGGPVQLAQGVASRLRKGVSHMLAEGPRSGTGRQVAADQASVGIAALSNNAEPLTKNRVMQLAQGVASRMRVGVSNMLADSGKIISAAAPISTQAGSTGAHMAAIRAAAGGVSGINQFNVAQLAQDVASRLRLGKPNMMADGNPAGTLEEKIAALGSAAAANGAKLAQGVAFRLRLGRIDASASGDDSLPAAAEAAAISSMYPAGGMYPAAQLQNLALGQVPVAALSHVMDVLPTSIKAVSKGSGARLKAIGSNKSGHEATGPQPSTAHDPQLHADAVAQLAQALSSQWANGGKPNTVGQLDAPALNQMQLVTQMAEATTQLQQAASKYAAMLEAQNLTSTAPAAVAPPGNASTAAAAVPKAEQQPTNTSVPQLPQGAVPVAMQPPPNTSIPPQLQGAAAKVKAAKPRAASATQATPTNASPGVQQPQQQPQQQQAARVSAAAQRTLLAADSAAHRFGGPLVWSTQLAQGIADRLGFSEGAKVESPVVALAEVQELALPQVPGIMAKKLLVDGIILAKNNTVGYVADNYNNRVWGMALDKGLANVSMSCVVEGPAMQVPTTLAMQHGRLWWVNAHLDSCFPFLPCPTHKFELHGIKPSDNCKPWPGNDSR